MTPLKLIFAGTPEFALPCLEALAHSQHHLLSVYTQPDRPAGRGRKLQPSAVKQWAVSHQLPVYQPINFKDPDTVAALSAQTPDLMIVIAYGLILPASVLAVPKYGCINVHGSLPPRWRGASPIQQAILHGDSESGITIMQMNAGMDTGDMLDKSSCLIEPQETAGTLHDKLANLAPDALIATANNIANGLDRPQVQDSSKATYASKINKEDALIDWQQPAEAIDRLIRAFNPWPIAFTHAFDTVIRIHEARVEPEITTAAPGTLIKADKLGLQVATGHQILTIQRLQFAGGKVISIADWLNAGRGKFDIGHIFQ